ncbi:MAG TPA: helix-turn-helix domain-containing protein [Candidatus Fimicola cottocaccae]|nr:helix-turn-helix domain-containing protein [Candidatus Fimicola cottocaccae]
MTNIESDKLTLTVKEMSKILGIGANKAYQLTKIEDFPTIRLGTKILIPVKGLNEWIENQSKQKREFFI